MSSEEDYDKLSKEEREVYDTEEKAREAAEQAGTILGVPSHDHV